MRKMPLVGEQWIKALIDCSHHASVAYSVIIAFTFMVVVLWRPSTLTSFLGRKSLKINACQSFKP